MQDYLLPKVLCLFRGIPVKLFYANSRGCSEILSPNLDNQSQARLKQRETVQLYGSRDLLCLIFYCNWKHLAASLSNGTHAEQKYFLPHHGYFVAFLFKVTHQRQQSQWIEHTIGWVLRSAWSTKCDSWCEKWKTSMIQIFSPNSSFLLIHMELPENSNRNRRSKCWRFTVQQSLWL